MAAGKIKLDSDKWGNAKHVFEQFGLTKGTLYKLADAGRIKSVAIKTKKDARKSIRLYSFTSIRELLASSMS